MENWLTVSLPTLIEVILTVLLIFSILIVLVRLSGLRSFAKMTSIDFATTVAIGSILATIVLNSEQSVLKGAVAIGAIFTFQTVFTYGVRVWGKYRNWTTNTPVFLMWDGEILYENLSNVNMGTEELMEKLRASNITQLQDVQAVVFETTGDVSVLTGKKGEAIDPEIMSGVKK